MARRSLAVLRVEAFTDGVAVDFDVALDDAGKAEFLRELGERLIAAASSGDLDGVAGPMRDLYSHEVR
jgi:hypothetical protein